MWLLVDALESCNFLRKFLLVCGLLRVHVDCAWALNCLLTLLDEHKPRRHVVDIWCSEILNHKRVTIVLFV